MSTTTTSRLNKYRTRCARCGNWVAPRAGFLTGSRGNWKVRCGGCADHAAEGEAREPSFREQYGRCEDAPCCGHGGRCGEPPGGYGYGFIVYG